MRALILALTCALAPACSSNEADGLRERCLEARAAIVDGHQGPEAATASPELQIELAKHRTALHRSLGEAFIERCIANGPAYADCVSRATDPDQRGRCEPDYRPAR